MPILLFDIDGTLVRGGGSGKAAMEAALRSAFGVASISDVVSYAGRTDGAIALDLLRAHDLPPTAENATRLTATYLDALPEHLGRIPGEVCPGVGELLARLRGRGDVTLGLLTGNVARGARTKLSHFGLWDYFPFGGFGDAGLERNEVARAAVVAAASHLNRRVEPSEVWVIGDTPLDVSCARHIGARVVAVATGWHAHAELALTGADVVLETLADASALPRDWFGDSA